jgi:YD repeat-containing protein
MPSQYVSWTTSTTYDADGKVLTTTNEQGLQTQNTYDVRGELIQVRQQAVGQNGSIVWLDTRTVYDADGQTVAATDQYQEGTTDPIHGTVTMYDADGNVIETDQVSGLVITLTGSGASMASVLTSAGTTVGSTTTQYDGAGREVSSTDENGLQTQTIYDVNGNVIRTRRKSVDQNGNLVWLDTGTVYDNLGRVYVTTDEYIEGSSNPIYATLTQYDPLGREIKSIRLQGVQVTIANGVSTLTNSGTQLWATQTIYDNQGRVSRNIAADGQITDYEYDGLGRKTAQVGTPVSLADAGLTPQDMGLSDGTGVTVRLRTETVYDSEGRVQVQKTNIREVVLSNGTIQINRSAEQDTSYEYDEFGNLIQTTYVSAAF